MAWQKPFVFACCLADTKYKGIPDKSYFLALNESLLTGRDQTRGTGERPGPESARRLRYFWLYWTKIYWNLQKSQRTKRNWSKIPKFWLCVPGILFSTIFFNIKEQQMKLKHLECCGTILESENIENFMGHQKGKIANERMDLLAILKRYGLYILNNFRRSSMEVA